METDHLLSSASSSDSSRTHSASPSKKKSKDLTFVTLNGDDADPFKSKESRDRNSESSEEECVICTEPFTGQRTTTLKCAHQCTPFLAFLLLPNYYTRLFLSPCVMISIFRSLLSHLKSVKLVCTNGWNSPEPARSVAKKQRFLSLQMMKN